MAKKNSKAPKTPRKSGSSRAAKRVNRKSSGSKSGGLKNMISGKIKWGEAALFALLGDEMGNVLQGTGLPQYFYTKYPMFQDMVESSGAADSGDFVNKIVGAGAGGKVLYDGMVDGKVTSDDLSVLLPYTIGTVFDANKHASSGSKGRW